MKIRDWLESQPFVLSLSSGFFGFFAHTGFAKALEEQGLKPAAYTGSSAGAIVAGALGGGMPATELEKILLSIKPRDFLDPAPGIGLLRGQKFENLLRRHFGHGFQNLERPVHIATFNILRRRTETFSSGDLAKAIRASAALPGMFQPVRIERQFYWDGGILDKHALDSIPSSQNVLSHSLSANRLTRPRVFSSHERGANTQYALLSRLPISGPHRLHLGPNIIESAYRQTLELLR